MYLSAFLPMIIIMWIKEVALCTADILNGKAEWSSIYQNLYLIIELVVLFALVISFVVLIKRNKRAAVHTITIKAVKNRSAEYYLAYYSLFILALIEFSLTDFIDIIVLALLLLVLGIVYIKNDLFFINPTINIFQSYIYEVEYEDNKSTISKLVISKEKLKEGAIVDIDVSEFEFTFLRRKHEPDNQPTN